MYAEYIYHRHLVAEPNSEYCNVLYLWHENFTVWLYCVGKVDGFLFYGALANRDTYGTYFFNFTVMARKTVKFKFFVPYGNMYKC